MPNTLLAIHGDALVRDRGRFVFGPLDIQVPYGEVLAVVGPNGSGKTTLFKLLLGAAHPDAGSVTVAGAQPGEAGHVVAAVLDTDYLVPDWTVPAAAAAIAPFYPSWEQHVFEHLIAQLDVPVDAEIKDLSRGEHSKLKLALALAPGPLVLLLDEPTSGLDPLAREQVLLVMRQFMAAGQRTIVFSTHISQDLEGVSDQILVLRDGQAVHHGAMSELTGKYVSVSGSSGAVSELGESVVGLRAVGGAALGDHVLGVVPAETWENIPSALRDSVVATRPLVDDVIKALAVTPPQELSRVDWAG